jgi:hypothetical protein
VIFFAIACKNDFLCFHCPLHRGLRVRKGHWHARLLSPPAKRTSLVPSQTHTSWINDTGGKRFYCRNVAKKGTLSKLRAIQPVRHRTSKGGDARSVTSFLIADDRSVLSRRLSC